MNWVIRHLETRLRYALLEDSVIYLAGLRHAGKDTLYKALNEEFTYVSFDEESKLKAAKNNPEAFIKAIPQKTVIDNAILAPEIFAPMRSLINALRLKKNGYVASQFLFTGFTRPEAIPLLLENLTGCIKILTLYPFSAAEIIRNGDINFIFNLFTKQYSPKKLSNTREVANMIKYATFPEISLEKVKNSTAWYKKYVDNLINNDTKLISDIEDTGILKKMLKPITNQIGEIVDYDSIAKTLKIDIGKVAECINLLHNLYLLLLIPSWNKYDNKEIVDHPICYMIDTSMLLALDGKESINESQDKDVIFRNFIATELTKHIEYLGKYKLYHFQNKAGEKIDFVIEKEDGSIVALNVKYDHEVTKEDFDRLEIFKKIAGKDFIKGVVLYLGKNIVTEGSDLVALPICTLWGGN